MPIKQLPIIKIEVAPELSESDLLKIKTKIRVQLEEYLQNYIDDYHISNDHPDDLDPSDSDDAEKIADNFKDTWNNDFDYMIDYYPNLIDEDHYEIQRQFILDWANDKK